MYKDKYNSKNGWQKNRAVIAYFTTFHLITDLIKVDRLYFLSNWLNTWVQYQ